MSRSVPLWTVPLTVALIGFGLAVPRFVSAQTCNRACDPSKRDTQGCCPAAPIPGPGTGPAPGRKCAVSAECPGDQVCIAYKCQKPPTTTPTPPTPPTPQPQPPPPPGGRLLAIGLAWNNDGDWAAHTGATVAEAQAAALQACSQFANGCYSVANPVPADRPNCIALFRNGIALRSQADPNLQTAIARANQDCSATGTTGPGCYQQLAICNDRPASAPSPWAHVGLAWNNKGGWATRPATSPVEAQALALAACNKSSGGCYNAQYPIPGEKLICFAIAYDGKTLYEHHDPNQATAVAEVMKTCSAKGGTCTIQAQACNNRR